MRQLLITSLGTVLTAFVALLVDWLNADARLKSLPKAVDEAAKALSFLDSWSKVRQQIEAFPEGKPKDCARDFSDTLLSQTLSVVKTQPAQRTASVISTRTARGVRQVLRVVRLQAPHHPLVWIPQLAFYASAIFTVLLIRTAESLTDTSVLVGMAATVAFWAIASILDARLSLPDRPPS